MLRMLSSGKSVAINATQTPMPMPRPMAGQDMVGMTSTGMRPWSKPGQHALKHDPISAPAVLPTRLMTAASAR